MKLNKIFMALAAMAVVGCSSDDLNVLAPEQQAAEDSQLIQLDPNFVIAGVGAEDNGTRTHWEKAASGALVNKFLPTYTAGASFANLLYDNTTPANSVADLTAQAVGLCWLGNDAPGTNVYTNYQFYHFGWLNNGETVAKVECDELTNGAFYDEITATAGTAGKEADETKFTLPSPKCDGGLNYNSGVYKTDNKSIFGGKYVVYYPFNEDFKEIGTIPATAPTVFDKVSESFNTPELGKATFRYSSPVEIKGGDQASDFGLYNLSSLVQLKVFAATAADITSGDKIDQIVLYSKKEQLLKQANLAADKIVAGEKGEKLYASTEGTKTITANFTAAVDLKEKDNAAIKSAYITVLPTTVDDLVVLVHKVNGTNGTWARIEMPKTVFEAGKAKVLNVSVTKDDFKSEFIAVDEASLITARNEARLVATATKPAKIEVIGDITLDGTSTGTTEDPTADQYDFNKAEDANITITGDAIIVPEDEALVVKFITIESDIRVLGKSCCDGNQGGKLYIQGSADGTTLGNVTMEPTKATVTDETTYNKYNPYVAYVVSAPAKSIIAAGKTFDVQAGRLVVAGAVEHKGNINIAEGAKVTVDGTGTNTGDLNFMGSTVVNDGTIEVLKGGKFDMTDANGNATANDGLRMTNNGKFIHNVDAGVGTAVQSMNQNGEYRCKVNAQDKLDDAFLQWTACSVIEMVDAGKEYNLGTAKNIPTKADGTGAYKHKGKYINIEVSTTSTTTFTQNADNNENIMIGNLTVAKGGLNVNFAPYTLSGVTYQRQLTVNGDMLVKAATNLQASKKITVKKNLTVDGATLAYTGGNKNVQGLAVTKNITVSAGNFNANDDNAINISCANFSLKKAGEAHFGNRAGGTDKTMTVTGTIDNPAGCTFDMKPATGSTLLAWITCSELKVGGTFTGARPIVE